MQFYNEHFLILFWCVPFMFLVYWYAAGAKKRKLGLLGHFSTIKRMSTAWGQKWRLKAFLALLAVVFAVFALARPQWGAEKKKIERKGVDVVFLLDTSLSMLAADIKPSRIEKAKLEIKAFLKKLKGDRVGLIPFSGSSFLQSPLTVDYSAFLLFLDAVNVGHIPDPGSELKDAIDTAIRSFPQSDKNRPDKRHCN